MATEITNQKEYLKKYLSGGGKEGKRKKKKKKAINGDRVTIIDDDIDISQLQTAEEAIDLFQTNEDAPQVVGVVDDRPLHLRVKDYRCSDLWKPVGEATNPSVIINEVSKTLFQIKNKKSDSLIQFKQSSFQQIKKQSLCENSNSSVKAKPGVSSDNKYGETITCDESSLGGNKTLADSSPPRKLSNHNSPLRKVERSIDSSPPRNRKHCDSSPPRRRKDLELVATCSPVRRNDVSARHQCRDSSPPRKIQKSIDSSPPQQSREKHIDSSPPRRRDLSKEHLETDPGSIKKHESKRSKDLSPSRKKPLEITEVKRKLLPGNKAGKYLIPAKRTDRMTKTLDGKTAGLQNARELIKETQDFRKREDDLFKNMDAEVSGVNAGTIIRDRKTGKIRDFAKEAEERREKEKREEETKEKYMQWGKGLKQVEEYKDKLAQDVVEMSKPLARYADDEDLETYLKEREREEDPMLQYIRSKKKKEVVVAGKPSKPEYMGEFMPNRYGIVPGHRWDGVDRSNGYEQKWLQKQNERLAIQEDIYKWSTEDM